MTRPGGGEEAENEMHSPKTQKREIHYAKLENSPRLQELKHLLLRGPHTTLQILEQTEHVRAVSAAISELRKNNIPVKCKCLGRGRFEYSIPEGQMDFNLKTLRR